MGSENFVKIDQAIAEISPALKIRKQKKEVIMDKETTQYQ